jgi:hypothetical protein
MRIGGGHCGASLAALLASGALVAGCGGGGHGSTASGGGDRGSTAATASDPHFAAKADAICKRADKRMQAAAGKYLGPGKPTRRQFKRFATAAVVPYTQQIIDGIRSLTPPASVADTVDEMLTEAQSVNDRLKAEPGELAGSTDPFVKVNRLAKQAGLDACAGD